MSEVQAFDDALLQEHLALAASQMPGPDYYSVLRWIHEILRPANYIEIGIRKADSLRLAAPETILRRHRSRTAHPGAAAFQHANVPHDQRRILR